MSRIGNKHIVIPEGVEVKLDGQKITVKGPKGTLEREIHKNISVSIENNTIIVTRPNDETLNRSLHGLTRTLLNNMIEGTTKGFERKLEVNGVGYRASKKGNNLLLNLGYSLDYFNTFKKKDDISDAICMVVMYYNEELYKNII